MPIPDYQSFMLPAIVLLSDGRARPRQDVVRGIADNLGLSDTDRAQLLPSGKATVISSRVGWALTYMKQAGVVKTQRRGLYELTQRGRDLLMESPSRIDVDVLSRYPEFRAFLTRSRAVRGNHPEADTSVAPSETVARQTPEEALEAAAAQLRSRLEVDLLDQVKEVSPQFFERIVLELLLRMGYGGSRAEAGQTLGGTGDGGIDGLINEDKLGLDVVYIQAKRWSSAVGRPEIQKFAGALQGHRAKKGVFLTSGSFSADAEEYAARIDSRIVLVDGRRLASLMFEHNLGVTPRVSYEVKQLDSDYFADE